MGVKGAQILLRLSLSQEGIQKKILIAIPVQSDQWDKMLRIFTQRLTFPPLCDTSAWCVVILGCRTWRKAKRRNITQEVLEEDTLAKKIHLTSHT